MSEKKASFPPTVILDYDKLETKKRKKTKKCDFLLLICSHQEKNSKNKT
jgi:hypothetical protein